MPCKLLSFVNQPSSSQYAIPQIDPNMSTLLAQSINQYATPTHRVMQVFPSTYSLGQSNQN